MRIIQSITAAASASFLLPHQFQSAVKIAFRLTCLAALLLPPSSVSPTAADEPAADARVRENVTYLASDALEGRGVGTKGLDQAAEFLAGKFKEYGLRTDLYQGTPFQKFDVTMASEIGAAEHNHLTLKPNDGNPLDLKLGESFTPLTRFHASRRPSGAAPTPADHCHAVWRA